MSLHRPPRSFCFQSKCRSFGTEPTNNYGEECEMDAGELLAALAVKGSSDEEILITRDTRQKAGDSPGLIDI